MFGGLALLAVSVFIVGGVGGTASSEFGRCAIRFSSSMGCRSPSSARRRSRPFAVDSAGRLMSYAGKIEIQCPKQTRRNCGDPDRRTVQRRKQRSAAAQHAPSRSGSQLCRRPLLYRCLAPSWALTGFAGEYWTLMADELIDTGAFDRYHPLPCRGGRIQHCAMGSRRSPERVDDPPPAGPQCSLPDHTRSLAPGRV